MADTPQNKMSILEVAWNRYAQYDRASYTRKRVQYRMRWWVAAVGILATLFAILSSIVLPIPDWGKRAIEIILILLPIVASVMAAFVNKFYPGTEWLVLRAGAEQVMKEIYQYRTILQTKDKRRRVWMEQRLREIQNQVYEGLNGEMAIELYKGELPPPYDDGSKRSDPGLNDMTAEDYFKLRLREQLEWHVKKVTRTQKERVYLQVWILVVGGLAAFLAALGGPFSLWVALVTALTTAMIGWQELKNLDNTVHNYSKVILDLNTVSDHWNQLDEDERKPKEFYRMVHDTEAVLWNQNLQYIKSMQEAFESAKLDEGEFIKQLLKEDDKDDNQSSEPAPGIAAEGQGAG